MTLTAAPGCVGALMREDYSRLYARTLPDDEPQPAEHDRADRGVVPRVAIERSRDRARVERDRRASRVGHCTRHPGVSRTDARADTVFQSEPREGTVAVVAHGEAASHSDHPLERTGSLSGC